jgi:predicted nucleotidyltransferase
MASSIDTYLRDLSYSFYLKKDSSEIARINTSKDNLLANLDKELGVLIKRRFVFGSYDRDTILPRSIDSKSDIDIMVVFNHTDYERTPETYRAWLKSFGDKYYKDRYGSEVVKSFPTVTIRLGNIHYDLVPAKEQDYLYSSSTLYIPGSYDWQVTNPNDVKTKLTGVNKKYNQIVRPIIRLMKAWNCNNGYPFDSYKLELAITEMNFHGDNIQNGFFYAVGQLTTDWNDSQTKKDKLNSLKYNIGKVKEALDNYSITSAKSWLHRIMPYG